MNAIFDFTGKLNLESTVQSRFCSVLFGVFRVNQLSNKCMLLAFRFKQKYFHHIS